MSANHAASLSLLLLHSCQLNLSDKAAVSSLAFQSLSAPRWPPQVCLITVCLSISLCRSPRHSLSALFCPHELAQAHRSTRHALSSPLPVKILPIPQGLHCVLWSPRLPSFIRSTPSGVCLLFLGHAPNLLGCKNKQTNLSPCSSPTEPTVTFHSAWNQECTGCKYWIHSLGVQSLFSKHLIYFYCVPDSELGNEIQMR